MNRQKRNKRASAVFAIMLAILYCGIGMAQTTGHDQILSVESSVLRGLSNCAPFMFANRAEIYPKEICFGDTIFLLAYKRNITPYPLQRVECLVYGDNHEYSHFFGPQCFAEVHYKDLCYFYSHEYPVYGSGLMLAGAPSIETTLMPNEEFIVFRTFFEFPTLREQDEEFWQNILNDLKTQESATVTLKVTYFDCLSSSPYNLILEASLDVVIKPRPDSEQMILNQWRRDTPWNKVLSGSKDSPVTNDTGQAEIPIGSKRYSPWTFIRVGHRKPSDPNNPTNVQGWLGLEKRFQPGVLLDDIVFTRMQLQYYTARTKEDADAMRRAFIDWINAKPRPQRAVYLGTILSGSLLYHEGIDERYKELCEAASDAYVQMDDEVRLQSVETPSE